MQPRRRKKNRALGDKGESKIPANEKPGKKTTKKDLPSVGGKKTPTIRNGPNPIKGKKKRRGDEASSKFK